MKKSILIVIAVIACMAISAPVFATDITGATQIGSVNFAPSTNVTVNVKTADTNDPTLPNTYCAASLLSSSIGQGGG